jgi:DNA modification methylase
VKIATSVRILVGDVRAKLGELPDESVDCVVTSPPYWSLRDYGVEGQIGMEDTYLDHIRVLVDVFRAVRRVLKRQGTVWLNYGDCYAGSWGAQSRCSETPGSLEGSSMLSARQIKAAPKGGGSNTGSSKRTPGLKSKDLIMLPSRLAIALQEDGWWLRSEIVWHKPNPMPESVTDRPSCAHEKIFLLSKEEKYFYDADAVRRPMTGSSLARLSQNLDLQRGSFRQPGKTNGPMKAVGRSDKQRGHSRRHAGFNERWDAMEREQQMASANLRNVWTVATAAFRESHFATFPPELVEPCIKAGCPEGGVVLDPFGGAGTVGLVAGRLRRDAILIELNPEYAAIARQRIDGDAPMFTQVEAAE